MLETRLYQLAYKLFGYEKEYACRMKNWGMITRTKQKLALRSYVFAGSEQIYIYLSPQHYISHYNDSMICVMMYYT